MHRRSPRFYDTASRSLENALVAQVAAVDEALLMRKGLVNATAERDDL